MSFHFFTDIDLLGKQLQSDVTKEGTSYFIGDTDKPTCAFGQTKYDRGAESEYAAINVGDTYRCNSDDIEPYAYAVCEGILAVAPVKNSNLVNIILKPLEQPKLPIPNIKYFIYRGVLRDSLFKDSNNTDFTTPVSTNYFADGFPPESYSKIIYNLAASGTGVHDRNTLLEHIETERKPTDPLNLSPNILLYNTIMGMNPNIEYLDSLFVTTGGAAGYAPNRVVQGGWVLGRFPSKSNNAIGKQLDRFVQIPTGDTGFLYGSLNIFGFEIILDTLDYNPKLNLISRNARADANQGIRNFNIIRIDNSSTTENLSPANKNKQLAARASMEVALNYMDPAAFWGSFYKMYAGHSHEEFDYTLLARKHADLFNPAPSADKISTPVFQPLTGRAIYDLVLKGDISNGTNFANKNRVYFDIRNQFNNSYNLYTDNCFNDTIDPISNKKNILYALDDDQSGSIDNPDPRSLAPRDYYNRLLPWLVFDVINDKQDPSKCDTQVISTANYTADNFGNDKPAIDYGVRLSFPTARDPFLEQYSLFYLNDFEWKDRTDRAIATDADVRCVLSTDNKKDNDFSDITKLFYLHYEVGAAQTDEVKIRINTLDFPANLPDGTPTTKTIRVPVAGWHRLTFIKHRTKLYDYTADEDLGLPTHLPDNLRAVKVPLPNEFLDYTFNMDMQLHYGSISANSLQIRVSDEYRYADITRSTGRDFLGYAGVAKDAVGDLVFFVNGRYHRQGETHDRLNLSDEQNIRLNIDSSIQITSNTLLESLVKSNAGTMLQRTAGSFGTENLEIRTAGFLDFKYKHLEFFSYIKIPISDWDTITDKYNLIIGASGIIFSKVYLSFKQLANNCGLPNQYEYWLKGFVITSLSGTSYDVFEVNEQIADIFNYNNFDTFGLQNIPDNFFQKASELPNTLAASTLIGGDFRFNSNIYSMRGMRLTYSDYYKLSIATNEDLKRVYSSSSNMGLNDIKTAKSYTSISYQGNIVQAIPPKFIYLRNSEMMNILSCKPLITTEYQRSHANPVKRVAVIFANPIIGTAFSDKYTMAHEYGHLMGLGDRYGYRAGMDAGDPMLVNTASGSSGTIPLYIPGDSFYNNHYRWYFNLMSLASPVPDAPYAGIPFNLDTQFTNEYNGVLEPVGPPDDYGYPTQFALFLTPQQWRIMWKEKDEVTGLYIRESYFGQGRVFLLPFDVANNISYVGNTIDDGSGAAVSDGNFGGSNGLMIDRNTDIVLGVISYGNVDDIMTDTNLQNELEGGGRVSATTIGPPDVSGSNDQYRIIATRIRIGPPIGGGTATGNPGDPSFGINVWNYVSPPGIVPPGSPIKYEIHPNRVTIIGIISRGN